MKNRCSHHTVGGPGRRQRPGCGHRRGAARTALSWNCLAEFFRAIPHSLRGIYHRLLVAIADELSGVKVFKVGQTRIRAYVVGVTADGIRAGVQTELVET